MALFIKFCIIGGLGFLVDFMVFQLLLELGNERIEARIFAFWVAAAFTWVGQRVFAFNDRVQGKASNQWLRHMVCVHLSGAINIGCFYLLSNWVIMPLAFGGGVLAGMLLNFVLASYVVFRPHRQLTKSI